MASAIQKFQAYAARLVAPQSSLKTPLIGLLICNVLWGLSFPLMALMNYSVAKFLLPVPESSFFTIETLQQVFIAALYLSIRFAAAIFMFRIFTPKFVAGLTRKDWLLGARTGVPFGIGMILQVMGLATIPASRSGFLTSMTVLFTPILVFAVYRTKPVKAVIVGCLFAILGSAVLTGIFELSAFSFRWEQSVGAGDYLTIAAAFMFSVSLLTTTWLSRQMRPSRIAPGMFLGLLFVTLPVLLILVIKLAPVGQLNPWLWLTVDPMFALLTVSMSALCTIIPFSLMTIYQHYFSEERAALIFTLEPVFASLWAMFIPQLVSPMFGVEYLNEALTTELLIGGALIIFGNCFPVLKFAKGIR